MSTELQKFLVLAAIAVALWAIFIFGVDVSGN